MSTADDNPNHSDTQPESELSEALILPPDAKDHGQAKLHIGARWEKGTIVGDQYEVIDCLGEGGMGIVYLLTNKRTGELVAAKRHKGSFVENKLLRDQFAREATAWTELAAHPNVVSAFDVLEVGYLPCILMEYEDGSPLSELLRRGSRITPETAYSIAIQTCYAMEFAHQRGHVHRDLKPANILIGRDCVAKVTDFGLVAARGIGDRAIGLGAVGGTWAYMPPEQWDGEIDPASDIYAFGVVLCLLFCGSLPLDPASHPLTRERYSHDTARACHEELHRHGEPTDPYDLSSKLSPEIRDLILHCLAKQRGDRPMGFNSITDILTKSLAARIPGAAVPRKPTSVKLDMTQANRRAWALLRLGSGAEFRADLDEALRQYDEAARIFSETIDTRGLVVSGYLSGNIHYHRGEFDEALGHYTRSVETARGDLKTEAHCRIGIGNILCSKEDYQAATDQFEESLRLFREAGDMRGEALALRNTGVSLHNLDRLHEAIVRYEESQALYEKLSDPAVAAGCQVSRGEALQRLGRPDEAETLYNQAFEVFTATGNLVGQATCYLNLGELEVKRGRPEAALKLYQQSLDLRARMQDKAGEAVCRRYMEEALNPSTPSQQMTDPYL